MSFMDSNIQQELINSFARIAGIKPEEVESTPDGTGQMITLKAHVELNNQARDFDVTIATKEKNKYAITGYITNTSQTAQIQKRPINQELKCVPSQLGKALERLLAKEKVRKGFIDRIYG